jgi:hypothetical protein
LLSPSAAKDPGPQGELGDGHPGEPDDDQGIEVPVGEHVEAVVLEDLDGALGQRRDQAEEQAGRRAEQSGPQCPRSG